MHKKFILDTNVLLHDPYALHKFHENHVIIPIDVIEELDHFKRDMSDLGYNARKVVSELDELRKKGKLGEGVGTDGGGLIQVIAGDYADYVRLPNLKKHKSIANQILGLAIYQNTHDSEIPTIIVTKSMNLRLKADALGIYAEDYEEPEYQGKFDYMGYFELSVATEVIEQINKNQQYSFTDQKFLPNEFLTLKSEDDPSRSVLVRVHGNEGVLVKPVINTNGGIMGIKPLNMEQHFAFDALLNDDIKLVSLMGKAGTGKTLVAVAAGLQMVLKEDKYHKLLVSRPTLAMGRDIGFIPGNIDEKMRPWMQPIYDAVELLCEIDRRARKR
ncbi:MAG: PIN domain-containing protein, partial [Lentisphaeria bacterium]|nr:PIN domain-containing protein [Lentisphaeria bacterium]